MFFNQQIFLRQGYTGLWSVPVGFFCGCWTSLHIDWELLKSKKETIVLSLVFIRVPSSMGLALPKSSWSGVSGVFKSLLPGEPAGLANHRHMSIRHRPKRIPPTYSSLPFYSKSIERPLNRSRTNRHDIAWHLHVKSKAMSFGFFNCQLFVWCKNYVDSPVQVKDCSEFRFAAAHLGFKWSFHALSMLVDDNWWSTLLRIVNLVC